MLTQTLDKAEQKERRKHAARWRQFRKDFLFTQNKLAEALSISRRTVQLIEGGRVSPTLTTQAKFRDFSAKCRHKYGEAA